MLQSLKQEPYVAKQSRPDFWHTVSMKVGEVNKHVKGSRVAEE